MLSPRLPQGDGSAAQDATSGVEQLEQSAAWCMDVLTGPFLRPGGYVEVSKDKLIEHSLIGLYFSASWCPPCRQFSRELEKHCKSIKAAYGPQALEILLIPRDRSREEWESYHASMPFLSLPFEDKAVFKLKERFHVTRIPCLIFITPAGEVVTKDGRSKDMFGFFCDPIAVYIRLAKLAQISLPKTFSEAVAELAAKREASEPQTAQT